MFKLSGAGHTFIQFATSPGKVDTTLGVALFCFEYMVHRYPVFKVAVGLVDTSEDIVAFIVIDYIL
jgi:hypothetical protein